MRENTLRALLNELKWSGQPQAASVVLERRVRERGAERIADLPFHEVVEILAEGVVVADGTFLPYHRMVRVRRGDEVLWQTSKEVRR